MDKPRPPYDAIPEGPPPIQLIAWLIEKSGVHIAEAARYQAEATEMIAEFDKWDKEHGDA